MKKIIVIGSGICGLTSGIYGLLNGYEVEIYEKNSQAGGFLTSWYRKDTLVDGCLHWMLGTKEGTKLNKIWKDNGGLDGVEIYHPNSFYEVCYEGKKLVFYRDIEKFKESLLSVSDNDEDEIEDLINAIKAIGIMEIPSELPYELADIESLKPDMTLFKKIRKYLKLSVNDIAERFNSEIIKYALKNCLVNNKFGAIYFLQTLSNFSLGNDSLPIGGSHGLRDRLVNKFISLGGKIIYNSSVEEIIVKNGVANGIRIGDRKILSDFVIAACDIHYTFEKLLKNNYDFEKYIKMDEDKELYPTYSYVIATYKTRHDFSNEEIAQVHKIDKYKFMNKEHDYLSIRHYGYEKDFINNGYTPVQVMLTTYEDDYEYIKNLSRDEYKNFKKNVGMFYQEKLKELFNDDFELVDVLTPLTYERYNNSYKGSFMTYVLSPRVNQVVRSALIEDVKNLVLANQWLMLPGGTPIAVVSGKFALQLVLYLDGKNYKI